MNDVATGLAEKAAHGATLVPKEIERSVASAQSCGRHEHTQIGPLEVEVAFDFLRMRYNLHGDTQQHERSHELAGDASAAGKFSRQRPIWPCK
jgi:hypothetical protein